MCYYMHSQCVFTGAVSPSVIRLNSGVDIWKRWVCMSGISPSYFCRFRFSTLCDAKRATMKGLKGSEGF